MPLGKEDFFMKKIICYALLLTILFSNNIPLSENIFPDTPSEICNFLPDQK